MRAEAKAFCRRILAGAAVTAALASAVSVCAEEPYPEISGLEYVSCLETSYAEEFDIYYYKEDYTLIDVKRGSTYLLVPEEGEVPEELPKEIKVIRKPVSRIYLAASSAMSLFRAMDALDRISFSGIRAEGWYIDEARKAMEDGRILFAGKYSQPDYEMLVSSGCDLAIESTMITHSPKVQEMFEVVGIPVFVDYSSYEDHPLGRTEWIRVYGCLLGLEKEADAFFESRVVGNPALEGFEKTGKKVAFFSVNGEGSVVIRSGSDYIPEMIELGGGEYVFPDAEDGISSKASVTVSMEEFYAAAVDADYLIYNGTIEQPIGSLEDLFELSSLFRDFKAVREGHVWVAGKDLYQANDTAFNLIPDVHRMLTDETEDEMTFLKKIN